MFTAVVDEIAVQVAQKRDKVSDYYYDLASHGNPSSGTEIKYETRRWLYWLTMPISWYLTAWVILKKLLMPNLKTNALFFDGGGKACRAIKEGSASWRALDIIYNYPFGKKKGFEGLVDDFWVGMMNAQAVRNRLKLVKIEVEQAVRRIYQRDEGKEVRILSLAAGSAQGIIEVISELRKDERIVRALLVDIDPTAVEYAKKLAEEFGVGEQITVVCDNAFKASKYARNFKPQIIEMLGLLDYLKDDIATKFIGQIREMLPAGGIFLTCNIAKNVERHFLKWVINWSMIYRSPGKIARILHGAEFTSDHFRIIYEPLGIHGLVIADKPNRSLD